MRAGGDILERSGQVEGKAVSATAKGSVGSEAVTTGIWRRRRWRRNSNGGGLGD